MLLLLPWHFGLLLTEVRGREFTSWAAASIVRIKLELLCLLEGRREVGMSAEGWLEGRGRLGHERSPFERWEEVLFARRGWGMLMYEWIRLLILLLYHCCKRVTHRICLREIGGVEVVIILCCLLFRWLWWGPEILLGSWRVLRIILICSRRWLKYCKISCRVYFVALSLLTTLSKNFRIATHCLWWSVLKTLALTTFIEFYALINQKNAYQLRCHHNFELL